MTKKINQKNMKISKKYNKNKVKHNKKKNTKFLKKRIIIENMFTWIKNNKRLQLRYDKYYKIMNHL